MSPIIADINILANPFELISFDYVPWSFNDAAHELSKVKLS